MERFNMPQILITILVTFFAGMGAGLGTGFAGMSAAAVISPMLITFLDMEPYMAVGIALSSDVLASAVSAYTYGKNKNLDVKNGLIMMLTVMLFTVVGSWLSSLVPSQAMGSFSAALTEYSTCPVRASISSMARGVSALPSSHSATNGNVSATAAQRNTQISRTKNRFAFPVSFLITSPRTCYAPCPRIIRKPLRKPEAVAYILM